MLKIIGMKTIMHQEQSDLVNSVSDHKHCYKRNYIRKNITATNFNINNNISSSKENSMENGWCFSDGMGISV